MDVVHLRADLACIIGILPRERHEPQRVVADLRLELDLEPVGATGDLARGVDYAAVDALLRFLAAEGRFRLLETLARAALIEIVRGPVARATLTLGKPDVLRAAEPGITLTRDAAWAAGHAVLADVPEVRIERRVASSVAAGVAAFHLGESRALPIPWTGDAAEVLVVTSRAEAAAPSSSAAR